MSYTVGELARLTGVSVRTLHHYDEIGLLHPGERTKAGYRQYSKDDIARLHAILVYRQLGFDLRNIAQLLEAGTDLRSHLEKQRRLLLEESERIDKMIRSVEAMMEAGKNRHGMTDAEMQEVFGAFDPREHEHEAEQRWGDTDAYRESARRTSQYGRKEWAAIKQEAEEINRGLIALLNTGISPDDPRAMDFAERHRRHISRWFYDCGYEMHTGLADMYIADPRFTKSYEDQATGLAAYVRAAIIANASRSAG